MKPSGILLTIVFYFTVFTSCGKNVTGNLTIDPRFPGPDTISLEPDTSILRDALRVASYNIEGDNRSNVENLWEQRRPLVKKMFDKYDFDVVALQEPFLSQLTDIRRDMPQFTYVGSPVTGVATQDRQLTVGILYKKRRVDLLKSDFFWLSETPGVQSRGWGEQQLRICYWALFREKGSGNEFYLFSVHLGGGAWVHQNSIGLLKNKIAEIAKGKPSLLAGDFNLGHYEDVYINTHREGFFKDSYLLAKNHQHPYEGSITGYGQYIHLNKRISHILTASCRSFEIESWNNLNEHFNGKYPSDHAPIMIDLKIPAQCESGENRRTISESFRLTTIKENFTAGYVVAESGVWKFDGALVHNNSSEDARSMAPRLMGANWNTDPKLTGPGFIETDFELAGLEKLAIEFSPTKENSATDTQFKIEAQISIDQGNTWAGLGSATAVKDETKVLSITPSIPPEKKVRIRIVNKSTPSESQTGHCVNILKVTFQQL